MELLKTKTNIDFMGQRKLAMMVSGILLLVSLVSFGVRGLNYGIDFTGGTLVEVGYPESADLGQIRTDLAEAGFPEATAQYFGTSRDVLVRLEAREDVSKAELSSNVLRVLKKNGGEEMELRRVEFVGPQVGEELTEQGGLAMLIALGAILIYVSLRFQWKFSLGAVAALFHDVIITIGFFSVLGLDFDLTVLAAVLAVIGYSLNDTIVVFDRVRENFRTMRKGTAVEIFNASLNQTLSRTIITSLTTLLVLTALFFLGGELIHEFATALIVGVVIGTYSSIYVASTSALALGVIKSDLMPVAKEGAEADARP
jgi:preprotein translocase subunit SecF